MNNKNILVLIMLVFLPSGYTYGQRDSLFGKNYVSIGVGYPNLPRLFFNVLQNKENFESRGTGPYHLKYENRVSRWLGIGLSINHSTFRVTYVEKFLDTSVGVIKSNNTEISSNNTAFTLRTNFHFIDPDRNNKWDAYFGFGFGYKFGKLNINSDYPEETFTLELPPSSKFAAEVTLGCRYFFDKNIGFYLEVGPAKSLVQLGVTTRF